MTDNEIIKALECCYTSYDCEDCPYYCSDKDCPDLLMNALDLINRQKAEIEKLLDYNENLQTANTALSNEILETKSEAIKEFAERFVNEKCAYCTVDTDEMVFFKKDIDNLVKEMTEGQ